MSYYMAFIMVGRVIAWVMLVCAPPVLWWAVGALDDAEPDAADKQAWFLIASTASYAAVIFCARYVQ